MAQLVGKELQFIGRETVVIPQDVVVGGATGSLDPSMAAQVEIKFGRVCDGAVHCGASWNVTTLPNPLSFVRAEETSMVTFLDHNVGNARPVILLQTDAGLPDGYQLGPCYLFHLSL